MSEFREHERRVAVRAVRDASILCRTVRNGATPEALAKKDKSPVTVADFGSQAVICRAIGEAFPGDPIIAEEDSAELRLPENAEKFKGVIEQVVAIRPEANPEQVLDWIDLGNAGEFSQRFWTLDPIDGTKGFLRNEQYAIALALIVDGRIEVAALGCPNLAADPREPGALGAIFSAVRGRGAFVSSIDGDLVGFGVPIRANRLEDPALARFCESVESGHSSHDDAATVAARLGITAPPARMDSQAKYAVVARGEADIYMRLPTRADYREKIWDHAAGVLVVEEAGGRVTDISGKPLDFTKGRELSENRGVLVTGGPLHDQVLSALRPS